MSAADLVTATDRGLWCEAGGFFIDPWRPVDRAVITHAHSDHARAGCGHYLSSREGETVLRARVGDGATIQAADWGEVVYCNGVAVSLHPAGHVLGAAQVRVACGGRVTVVSGDYRSQPDATTTPFEPVRCDTFISECTFGLPIYRWPDPAAVFADINAWWRANRDAGRASVIFAYALGKAQRVLSGVDASIGPIVVHGAVARFVEAYRAAGRAMPTVERVGGGESKPWRGRALVVAPPSAAGTPWLRRVGPVSTAMASGWMAVRGTRRRRAIDRGFVLSDHVDWTGLMDAVAATGASRVGLTHGYTHAVCRRLRETGLDAFELRTQYEGETDEGADGGDSAEALR